MKQSHCRNRIGILGPFSFGNLGNAALQEVLVQALSERFSDAEFYGCSIDLDEPAGARRILPFPIGRHVPWPEGPTASQGVPTGAGKPQNELSAIREWIKRTPPFSNLWRTTRATWQKTGPLREEMAFCVRAYRFAKGFRLLVVGLGGVFDEVWGGKWGDLYCIFRWAVLARFAGTPVVYLSVGVEEINTTTAKFFCASALLLAEYRSFRDEESKRKVEAIGVLGENHVFPDLAFGLKHRVCKGAKGTKSVGVSPMAYCDPRFWPVKDIAAYKGYVKTLASFVSWLLHSGYEVVLFPTQIRMDRIAVQEVEACVLENLSSNLHGKLRDVQLSTVHQCLTLLSQLDVVVTSRLHGVILSSLVGTPVLALSPATKINRLMEDMELNHYVLDIRQIELETLINGFRTLEANLEDVSNKLQSKVAKYEMAVEAQFKLAFPPESARDL